MIKIDGKIAGYMCINFSGEPAYDNIKGSWNAKQDYAVVHRMAFNSEFIGIGLADTAFRLIEEVCLDKEFIIFALILIFLISECSIFLKKMVLSDVVLLFSKAVKKLLMINYFNIVEVCQIIIGG